MNPKTYYYTLTLEVAIRSNKDIQTVGKELNETLKDSPFEKSKWELKLESKDTVLFKDSFGDRISL